MADQESAFAASALPAMPEAEAFAALSARRLLVIGGIALIVMGMLFGDIFAVFVLHPNADRIGQSLVAVTEAVATRNPEAVGRLFTRMGGLLENRGTKVDAHVHMTDFGYLALLLAIVLPYVSLTEEWKKRLAAMLIASAVILPVGVFCIHYVGLAFSPLESIGWASIVADFGGLLAVVASVGFLVGLWRYRSEAAARATDPLLSERSWSSRILLAGGTLLILAGFLHGALYAAVDLYRHEETDVALLSAMAVQAMQSNTAAAAQTVNAYGNLQAEKAVKIAAHAHIIEFGLIGLMVAFFQPYVFLSEHWKRRWAVTLLAGGAMLPVCVLLELRWGLLAGGLADFGGFLTIVALAGMLAGILRYTGRLDAPTSRTEGATR